MTVGKNAMKCVTLSLVIALSGCQTMVTKQKTPEFEKLYYEGDYQNASVTALQSGKIDKAGKSNSLLWSLQAASALTACGDYEYSRSVLDQAEQMMKKENSEGVGKKTLEKATTALLNSSFNDYTPTVYDGVMLNTYKAFDSMMISDSQGARIEFNRAADRQRRAEDSHKEKIQQQQEKLDKQKEKGSSKTAGFNYQKSFGESQNTIYKAYPELEAWKVYPDFVNPYTDYLHGLFFFVEASDSSDLSKSRQSLRRVAGMMPNNHYIKQDLEMIDAIRKGKISRNSLQPTTWVIFENGQAPKIGENLIELPMFLVNDKVDYLQIALPKIEPQNKAFDHLNIHLSSKKQIETEQVASIDRVIQTEFKKEFPYKVTDAILGTMTKAFIQYQAKKELGALGSIAGMIYQSMTAHADTRSWSALPKEVQIARFTTPQEKVLKLTAEGLKSPFQVKLSNSKFNVVFVKATSNHSVPSFKVVGFDA